MKIFSAALLLLLGQFSKICSENEETRESLPSVIVSSAEQNERSASVGISLNNGGLSSQNLSELHHIAKNISRSKGIYRHVDDKSPYEQELRRSFLNKVAVVSDSDTMRAILQTFTSDENKLECLEKIEFLVHQYDVAVNFAAAGGIKLITPYLYSSDDRIAAAVASVLGASMQSNPTVQKLAIKLNIGANLFKLLSHKSPVVLSRIIFALGSFLRNSPEAQAELIAIAGTSKLADILKSPQIATNTKLKIINLFNDLAVEQQTAELYPNGRSLDEVQKFQRLFAHEIQQYDICKIITRFLDFEDYDTHQKIVAAMMSLYSICYQEFKDVTIDNRLHKLLKIYNPDSDENNPLYPNIDKDLKQVLHSELKALLKAINIDNFSKDNDFKIKMEL